MSDFAKYDDRLDRLVNLDLGNRGRTGAKGSHAHVALLHELASKTRE